MSNGFEVKRLLRGFTLVEGLMFLFIFALITLIFFQTFAYGTALIQQSKYRLGAIALANQKMEIVRSLDYDTIGTLLGVPAGSISQDEDIQVNNTEFHVHTFIRYVDDAFDGVLGGVPNDIVPNDYKRVRIEVSWGGRGDAEKVQLFSTFAPLGIEQPAGGGILSINILDSQGNGVSGATVSIVNGTVAPAVNLTTTTDASGNLFLVGAPASVQGYRITFSKNTYFGSASYAPFPTTAFVPVDVHASVVDATVNQSSFVMDRNSTIELRTRDPFDAVIPDINYRIDGGRQIGAQSGTGLPVYYFGEDSATNASGEKVYSNQSYGGYTWVLDSGETGYEFVRLNPENSSGINSVEVLPNVTQSVRIVLADKLINGTLFTVTSAVDGTPVSSATIRLRNVTLSYDETVTTSLYGKGYFPITISTGLQPGTYDFEISSTGFTTATGTVDIVSGLANKSVPLSP